MNDIIEGLGKRAIRAQYDCDSITVYQAYSDAIADSALAHGNFISPPFSMGRMTWIKPSFLWMMYRSGWGLKDLNQKRILAIKIRRDGFESALRQSILAQFDLYSQTLTYEHWQSILAKSHVRVQWDPERDIYLNRLNYKSIQIGLRGEAVRSYISEWICSISEVTELANQIRERTVNKNIEEAKKLLPIENVYPLPDDLLRIISATR